jgi:hypothetical protein
VAPVIDGAGSVNSSIPAPYVQYLGWREVVELQVRDDSDDELGDLNETDDE